MMMHQSATFHTTLHTRLKDIPNYPGILQQTQALCHRQCAAAGAAAWGCDARTAARMIHREYDRRARRDLRAAVPAQRARTTATRWASPIQHW